MSHILATVISRLFDPSLMLFILFSVLFYGSPIFIPALLLMIVLPFVLFVVAYKTTFVSNWDVSNRRERPKILWTLVAIEGMSSIVLQTATALPIVFALFGFALITHFWKMSGHAMAAALTTGFVVMRFGWGWWPVLLIVPLVGWARVVTKNHILAQVIAGAIYSWFLLVVFYYWII